MRLVAQGGHDSGPIFVRRNDLISVTYGTLIQEYFRNHKPPLLAVWGKNDPFFVPPGAEAFKRDNPHAVVQFFDTGHFALETHACEIAESIREFLK